MMVHALLHFVKLMSGKHMNKPFLQSQPLMEDLTLLPGHPLADPKV